MTGNLTPFHDIRQLQYLATTQANNDNRQPNVIWGKRDGEDVVTVEGLAIPWSGWKKLYTKLIERIKVDLEFVTFSAPLALPPQDAYIENLRDERTGINFAQTLPKQYEHCKTYLMEHVLRTRELRDRYVLPEPVNEWNRVAAKEWMDRVDQLIESFCVLGHLASGPGGRGTEWVSMLAMNDQNGSRSVFWTIKGLCFMTGYSKVFQFLLYAHCLISLC